MGNDHLDGGSQKTSLEGVYSGGDATRGGATAVLAAGDGQAAAREIVGDIPFSKAEIEDMVENASRYTDLSRARRPSSRRPSSPEASSSHGCARR